ncbi:hypothetical protein RM530_13760 [Algiphilus sp. W345]|uniref:Uncharacterized protein n=1 Tax=Banduia mediterranea TaxID=3075609 RepID=A0ABU2WKL6_9GAMM|nr:hypothetical protein [Algiphilus sp. W345]MDT0498420.1 hypothetical protein [Algiphilus sp. W345]
MASCKVPMPASRIVPIWDFSVNHALRDAEFTRFYEKFGPEIPWCVAGLDG